MKYGGSKDHDYDRVRARTSAQVCQYAGVLRFARFVSTALSIETFVGNTKPLDRLATNDVLIQNLVDIVLCNATVPHGFWVDDYGRTVLALVHAPSFVGADSSLQAAPGSSGLEKLMQFPTIRRVAASTRMLRVSMVGADEDVSMK